MTCTIFISHAVLISNEQVCNHCGEKQEINRPRPYPDDTPTHLIYHEGEILEDQGERLRNALRNLGLHCGPVDAEYS